MAETEIRKKTGEPGKYVKVSLSVPFSLLLMFDEEAERRGYNRSEAIRKGMRRLLELWTGRRL